MLSAKEKRKITVALTVGLAISFGITGYYSMRGTLASYAGVFRLNDVCAFLLAAVLWTLVYEAVAAFAVRRAPAAAKSGIRDCAFVLPMFVIPANVFAGLTKLLYFAYPFLYLYGEMFLDFIYMLAAFAGFTAYCLRRYYPRQSYGGVVMYFGGMFLGASAIINTARFVITVLL